MSKFFRRPGMVEAEQWFPGKEIAGVTEQSGAATCTTIGGHVVALQAGDYVITEADGVHHYPCTQERFEKLYARNIVDSMYNIPDEVHTGSSAEAFTSTILFMPGKKPQLVFTPRFVRGLEDDGLSPAKNLKMLLDAAVTKGASDIVQEILRKIGTKEGAPK